jgi:hypothetical protein
MVAHCSIQAMVVPYAINIMNKHQPWLDHDACETKMVAPGGQMKPAVELRNKPRALSRRAYARAP